MPALAECTLLGWLAFYCTYIGEESPEQYVLPIGPQAEALLVVHVWLPAGICQPPSVTDGDTPVTVPSHARARLPFVISIGAWHCLPFGRRVDCMAPGTGRSCYCVLEGREAVGRLELRQQREVLLHVGPHDHADHLRAGHSARKGCVCARRMPKITINARLAAWCEELTGWRQGGLVSGRQCEATQIQCPPHAFTHPVQRQLLSRRWSAPGRWHIPYHTRLVPR